MGDSNPRYTGGCLCRALRYEADGEPIYAGYCFCGDCRKVSGSGFIPFMGFPGTALRVTGEARRFIVRSARGSDAVRNSCAACSSLVFGGELGKDDHFTIYAGSLDDPGAFRPTMAIFARDRPNWAVLPPDLKVFDRLPS